MLQKLLQETLNNLFEDKEAIDEQTCSVDPPIEHLCQSIYKETASFYERQFEKLGNLAFGYKILYGPPLKNPTILFFGYQPGGRLEDAVEGERVGERINWPKTIEYATANWPLAIKVRNVWGPTLLNCVGINYIYFRSPKKEVWETLSASFRHEAESFCKVRNQKIVEALNPKTIVIFGFDSVPDFKPDRVELMGNGRRLIQSGTLWGFPAFAVIHLSGARISRDEMDSIQRYFGVLLAQSAENPL
jgi:hypothetical protein